MPRYFFDVEDDRPARDVDGADLADLDAARALAVRLSGELLREAGAAFWIDAEWRLRVRDEDGAILFILRFHAEPARDGTVGHPPF